MTFRQVAEWAQAPESDARVLSAVCPLPRDGSVHFRQLQLQLPNGQLVDTDWVPMAGGEMVELIHTSSTPLPPGKPRVVLHEQPITASDVPQEIPEWLSEWVRQHPGLWFGDRHLPVVPKSGSKVQRIGSQHVEIETWAGVEAVGGGFANVRAYLGGVMGARVQFALNCGMDAQTPGGDVRVDSIRFDAAGAAVVAEQAPAHFPNADVFFEGTLASFTYWIGPQAESLSKMGGHSLLVGEFSFSNPDHFGWTAAGGVLPADPTTYAEREDRLREPGELPSNTVVYGYRPKVGPNYAGVTGGGELGMFFGSELAAAGPRGIRQLLWDCWADETRGANLISDGGKPFVPEVVDFKYDIIETSQTGAVGFNKNHLGELGAAFKAAWLESQTDEPKVPWHSALQAAQPDDEQHWHRLINRLIAAVATCNCPVARWKLTLAAGSIYCSQGATSDDWKTNSLQALLNKARANPSVGGELGRGEGEGAESVREGRRHLSGTVQGKRLVEWMESYDELLREVRTPSGAIMRKHNTKYANQIAKDEGRAPGTAPGVSQHWEGILAAMALPIQHPAVEGALDFARWCWSDDWNEPYAWVCIADEPDGPLYGTLEEVPDNQRSMTLRKRWVGDAVEYYEAPATDSFYLGALLGRCLLPAAPDRLRRKAAGMLLDLANGIPVRTHVENRALKPEWRGMWISCLGALDLLGADGFEALLTEPLTGVEGITQ